MNLTSYKRIVSKVKVPSGLSSIADKVFCGKRINEAECKILFETNEFSFLGMLASFVKDKYHSERVYFNKNIHIEPTNICVYNCRFCSYSRKAGDMGAWELSIKEIIDRVKPLKKKGIKEVHIVGGVHPEKTIEYYSILLKEIKKVNPTLHIKAFTAVELAYIFTRSGLSYKEGLSVLKESGLNSLPGGGAEIFNYTIRNKICKEKTSATAWLKIHEEAHKMNIPSNATMLYGHLENYSHRIDHMRRLRSLQDKTNGFNAFIPLKFRNKNNKLSGYPETNIIEDLKNYAVSRIYLDNIPHLKAYWPMIGKDVTQLSLNFGVDDIDGTIEDSTKIYSMAGSEANPVLSIDELSFMVNKTSRIPVERDSLYNIIKEY